MGNVRAMKTIQVLNIEVIVMFGNMAYGSFDFGAHEFVQTC
jgi:hypothetical protein